MFHLGNVEIGQLSRGVGDRQTDRQTDGVSYLKQSEAHTVLQCKQTHKKGGGESILTSEWLNINQQPTRQ
jgi:hypothetical protein